MLLVFFDGRLMAEHLDYTVKQNPVPEGYCTKCQTMTQTAAKETKCPKCQWDFTRSVLYKHIVILPANALPAKTVVQMIMQESSLLDMFGIGTPSIMTSALITDKDTPAGELIQGTKIEAPKEPQEDQKT